jgi:hypothetical protein
VSTINNHRKKKFSQQSNDDDQYLSIIECPHLTLLELDEAHDDYVEQFLLDTKTCLPMKVDIEVHYEALDTVTHNFTRGNTNQSFQIALFTYTSGNLIPMHLKDYLPHAEML